MKFDVVTVFPDLVERMTSVGVVGRARENDLLDVAVHDLRDFTTDRHRTVDDTPYGGGPGMVLKVEPFLRSVALVKQRRGEPDAVVLMSPQGATFTHEAAVRLSRLDHVVLLCGRYQGVDERVREQVATEEISIGDYVLSGGELAAAVVIDAVSRQVPGVVGNSESVATDSFVRRILDCPTYTRPAELNGHAVPEVLISGDHAQIRRWRKREAVRRTLCRRPDLLRSARLDDEEREYLRELRARGTGWESAPRGDADDAVAGE
jgi:tRNA (guanine37-N1)-methyltransferase